jgi:hypothetical protein
VTLVSAAFSSTLSSVAFVFSSDINSDLYLQLRNEGECFLCQIPLSDLNFGLQN